MKATEKTILIPVAALFIALSLIMSACEKNDKLSDEAASEISARAVEKKNESPEELPPQSEQGAEEENDMGSEDNDAETDEIEKKISEALKSPGEVKEPSNAPPKGTDRTIYGIPELIDIRVEDDGNLLAIVNKYHAVSADYKPADMVGIDPKLGTWSDMEMKKEAYDAYLKLHKAAKKRGYNLKICSAYRSYNTQASLFNSSLAAYGWKTTYIRSAYPGRSEHHTGLAIDITSASMGWGLTQDFAEYEDGKWLNENCHRYGYILRYLKGATEKTGYMYEPWHFRYVGKEAAKEIMEEGITLEEYVEKIEIE